MIEIPCFCFAFPPTLMLTPGESISFSANKPWALWNAVSCFYEGLNLPYLFWDLGTVIQEPNLNSCPPPSQWRAILAKSNTEGPIQCFCKDFECSVTVLVHVLYFVAFLVPGLFNPTYVYAYRSWTLKSYMHVSPLCLSQMQQPVLVVRKKVDSTPLCRVWKTNFLLIWRDCDMFSYVKI